MVKHLGNGKSTLDRLKDTLKNGLLAMLYEMGKKGNF